LLLQGSAQTQCTRTANTCANLLKLEPALWTFLANRDVPTIIRLIDPIHPLHVNLRTGTVMSLAGTATGRLFAAYLPRQLFEELMREDFKRLGPDIATPLTSAQVDGQLAEVRHHRLSRSMNHPTPGVTSFAAPVFDYSGTIVLGITLMGSSGVFDPDWHGPQARAARDCAAEVSKRLGHAQPASAAPAAAPVAAMLVFADRQRGQALVDAAGRQRGHRTRAQRHQRQSAQEDCQIGRCLPNSVDKSGTWRALLMWPGALCLALPKAPESDRSRTLARPPCGNRQTGRGACDSMPL